MAEAAVSPGPSANVGALFSAEDQWGDEDGQIIDDPKTEKLEIQRGSAFHHETIRHLRA